MSQLYSTWICEVKLYIQFCFFVCFFLQYNLKPVLCILLWKHFEPFWTSMPVCVSELNERIACDGYSLTCNMSPPRYRIYPSIALSQLTDVCQWTTDNIVLQSSFSQNTSKECDSISHTKLFFFFYKRTLEPVVACFESRYCRCFLNNSLIHTYALSINVGSKLIIIKKKYINQSLIRQRQF